MEIEGACHPVISVHVCPFKNFGIDCISLFLILWSDDDFEIQFQIWMSVLATLVPMAEHVPTKLISTNVPVCRDTKAIHVYLVRVFRNILCLYCSGIEYIVKFDQPVNYKICIVHLKEWSVFSMFLEMLSQVCFLKYSVLCLAVVICL